MPNVTIREAGPEDAELVASLIRELAAYERILGETNPKVESLRQDLRHDATPRLYCLIAEANGAVVGMAIYYLAYSTNRTSWTIHLEDLFVRESHRGRNIGKTLMQRLGAIAKEGGYDSIELEVMTWNSAAKFYEHLGAVVNPEANRMYFKDDALKKLTK